MKSPTAAQRKFRNEVGQDLLALKAFRDGLKSLRKPEAFWIAKDRLGQAMMKRLLMLCVLHFIAAEGNQFVLHQMNLLFLEAQFTKFYKNDFGSMLTRYKLFKLSSQMIDLAEQLLLKKFFSALLMTMTNLNSVFFPTKQLFMYQKKVNRHNMQIWGSANPREVVEKERDSPKINVWYGLMYNQIIGSFIFAESTNTANIYLDMLKHYVVPQQCRN